MNHLAMFGGTPVRSREFPAWPVFDESEENAVVAVLRSGKWWSYSQSKSFNADRESEDRSKVAELEDAFARSQGATYAIACASGTAALEVALKAAGIGPGDEVIVPPYTFVATANAPLLLGATPIFCDIELGSLNIDPASMKRAITPRTKAVIPVHFAGMAVDMENLLRIARAHNLFVLEDAAHAPGAAWNGQGLGTVGDAGAFSFQASKNMTAGEGGMIVTDNREFTELCASYVWAGRECGRPWYEHHRLGWNYRLTEFQAAILIEQLKRLDRQNERRTQNALYLNTQLTEIPGIYPLEIPLWVTKHAFHIYVFLFNEREFGIPRERFLLALREEGIPCSSGYAAPLYENPMFLKQQFHANGSPLSGESTPQPNYASFAELCPNAERACSEAVWIEHRVLLGDRSDMEDIVNAVTKIYECRADFN